MRELARDLGLADAGRAGEQERADRLALVAQARARHLDGGGQRVDRLVLAEDRPASGCARGCCSTSRSDADTLFGGMRAMRATTSSICAHVDDASRAARSACRR